MAELMNGNTHHGMWWLGAGATPRPTIRITIICESKDNAEAVLEYWQQRQSQNYYQENQYIFNDGGIFFGIHNSSIITLIDETTVQVTGEYTGQNFLIGFHTLLTKLSFQEAKIECNDDRNPKNLNVFTHQRQEATISNENLSTYNFKKMNESILLF